MTRFLATGSLLLSLGLITGCAPGNDAGTTATDTTAMQTDTMGTTGMTMAMVRLEPRSGSNVTGEVTFTEEAGGTRIVASITGLTPGDHGFHVHENGDCSAPDATSAGDHYNPHGSPHGGPDAASGQRHVGDFGNITADDSGTATVDRVIPDLPLTGENAIVGRALLVHAEADDLTTQPSGDSGARVACGVIEMQGGMGGMGGHDMTGMDTTGTGTTGTL